MNPPTQCCHNPPCPTRGQRGRGNMRVQSRGEQRYRCTPGGQTCAVTNDTPFYRLRTAADAVTLVLTLLSHGCPTQAIVAAAGVEERTVAAWLTRVGQHGQRVHQHMVQQGGVDRQHVQADELWVKLVGRRVWMAMAMAVPSRLWLGGVISPYRDVRLMTALVQLVRSGARRLAILVCVDGWASSVTAVLRMFRHPVRSGRCGRPSVVEEPGLLWGPVVKRDVQRRVVRVERRVVRGPEAAIVVVLTATHSGTEINTADIERLHATFRASLALLVRRGRAIAHTEAVVTAGMWLVEGADHCCWRHQSLRLAAPAAALWKWQARTSAMAAGLRHHRWTMLELMRYHGLLPAWVAPKRRGRPPKRALQPTMAAAGRVPPACGSFVQPENPVPYPHFIIG
jgi:transposase-like protein